jgi:hypothetical protein
MGIPLPGATPTDRTETILITGALLFREASIPADSSSKTISGHAATVLAGQLAVMAFGVTTPLWLRARMAKPRWRHCRWARRSSSASMSA